MAKSVTRSNISNGKNEWSKIHFYWYFGPFSETIFIIKNVYVLFAMLLKKPFQCFKVSEYPFKKNKNTLKIMQVLLYTHFYNISLNVLRPNFLTICNLLVSHFPNIRKIRVKVGPKTNYFSYFMSSYTDKIVVFNNFFSLICSQPRDKQNRARNFLLFK